MSLETEPYCVGVDGCRGGWVACSAEEPILFFQTFQEILEKYNEEEREKLFILKPLYQRVLIVFGGPLANFLLALVIFFSIYTFIGKDFTPVSYTHLTLPTKA